MTKKVWITAVLLLVALDGFIGWRAVKRIAEGKRLRELDITIQRITIAPVWLKSFVGYATLARLLEFGEIHEVGLGRRATDESVAVAARMKEAYTLVFRQTKNITPAGYAQLANATTGWDESGNIAGYLKLYFFNTGATDETLASLPPLPGIEVILLIEPAITDAGIVHLKKHPDLNGLDARCTAMTAKGAANLQAALPNCDIDLPIPGTIWSSRLSPARLRSTFEDSKG